MTFNAMQFNRHMNHGASASCAQANGSCAHAAAMQNNTVIMILDAVILASIIICSLILGVIVRISSISLLVLALVALILVGLHLYSPDVRARA